MCVGGVLVLWFITVFCGTEIVVGFLCVAISRARGGIVIVGRLLASRMMGRRRANV